MGMMYWEGVGVKKNLIRAYALLDLAGRDGHAQALNIRDEIATEMTEEQEKQAKEVASKWQQGKPITIS